jgi:hypothetical protein
MATYVNDLRLKEIATGDESGTWGTSTNTNLELIAEAFSYSTDASFGSDANATTTIADGGTDPFRSIYIKVTSGASLSATRQLTIAPDTVSKIFIIENATTGSQSISIKQGSGAGAAVTIPNGDVKVVATDGGGSGAIVYDLFTDLNLAGTTSVAALTSAGRVLVDDTTEATSTTDGSLQTDSGLSVAKDVVVGDDVKLLSDSAVLSLGADSDATVTHDGTTGVTIAANPITLDSGADIVLDADGADIIFKDAGTSIGTFTNSSSDFVIQANVQDKDILFKGDDGGSGITALTLDMSAAGDATFNGAVYAGGNIGLDSTDFISFTDNTRMDVTINGSNEFRFESDGDFHADGDVIAASTTVSSDERLKENIETIENATDKIKQIRGVTFTKKHSGEESAGVIAQEVEKILPSAVKEKILPMETGDEETLWKTVKYDQLHALLIESVKELTKRVEELENGNTE